MMHWTHVHAHFLCYIVTYIIVVPYTHMSKLFLPPPAILHCHAIAFLVITSLFVVVYRMHIRRMETCRGGWLQLFSMSLYVVPKNNNPSDLWHFQVFGKKQETAHDKNLGNQISRGDIKIHLVFNLNIRWTGNNIHINIFILEVWLHIYS